MIINFGDDADIITDSDTEKYEDDRVEKDDWCGNVDKKDKADNGTVMMLLMISLFLIF